MNPLRAKASCNSKLFFIQMLDINIGRALIIIKENIWWLNQNIGFYLDWVNQIRKKHNKFLLYAYFHDIC
jgi:hypothetical protein